MFNGCANLISLPDLPALSLTDYCYYGMFSNCTGLINASVSLLATQMKEQCYANMFAYCDKLNTAVDLPAETLAPSCYKFMFCGCNGLTSSPELTATTLVVGCYEQMFSKCHSLNTIKIYYQDVFEISSSSNTYSWVDGVSPIGTLYYKNTTQQSANISGIPNGWNVTHEW